MKTENTLNDRSYERLKELITTGRKFHYRNFILAALIFVFLSKNIEDEFSLFLGLKFELKYLLVFIYVAVVIHSMITIDIIKSVWRNVNIDNTNEVPFNWIVLSPYSTKLFAKLLLVLPWVMAVIGLLNSELQIISDGLILGGFFSLLLPNYVKVTLYVLINKVDENGIKLTLSIFALRIYRMLRQIILALIFFYPIYIFAIHKNEEFSQNDFGNLQNSLFIAIPIIILMIGRQIWPIFHKKIDKFGAKYGFDTIYRTKENLARNKRNTENY